MRPEQPSVKNEKLAEIKSKVLDTFKKFRFDYIEDIPPNILGPDDLNYHFYKCRGNFFSAIKNYIGLLIDIGILSRPESVKRGREFIDYVANRKFSSTNITTQEDIAKANAILDFMIQELS